MSALILNVFPGANMAMNLHVHLLFRYKAAFAKFYWGSNSNPVFPSNYQWMNILTLFNYLQRNRVKEIRRCSRTISYSDIIPFSLNYLCEHINQNIYGKFFLASKCHHSWQPNHQRFRLRFTLEPVNWSVRLDRKVRI